MTEPATNQSLTAAAEAIRAVAASHQLSITATLATADGETHSLIESPFAKGDTAEMLFRTRLEDHGYSDERRAQAETTTLALVSAQERALAEALYELGVVEDELRRRKSWQQDLTELRDALHQSFAELSISKNQVQAAVVRAVRVFSRLYSGQAGYVANWERHLERTVRDAGIRNGKTPPNLTPRRLLQIRKNV